MHRRDMLFVLGAATSVAAVPALARSKPTAPARMSHGFHATIQARPGMGAALIALLYEAPAFQNDDCLVFLIGRSKANPDIIYLTEGWTTEAAHKRFTESATAKAYIARFGALVAGESRYLDEVPIGGKPNLA